MANIDKIDVEGVEYFSWEKYCELNNIKSRKTLYNQERDGVVDVVRIGASPYYAKKDNENGAAPTAIPELSD